VKPHRSTRFVVAAFLAASLFPLAAHAVRVGESAPDFTGTDSNGKSHKLSEYRGKYVVLEWTNSGCPFTKKHYDSGNMQALQKEWTGKGVVWLTVLSSHPGGDGYMTPEKENAYLEKEKAAPTAVLLDTSGAIGHQYNAKTTPHMFVVDPQGKLVYDGAIDDKPTTDVADVKGAKNYVSDALTASMAGKQVAMASTRPYGCGVKYAD